MNVKKLIAGMTVEEKVAQLCSLMSADLLTPEGELSPARMRQRLKHGIGFIASLAGDLEPARSAEIINATQKYLGEQTRLGIPAIAHQECLHGVMARGHTIFPQAIGMAATFDPGLLKEVATAIGREGRARGYTLALSPVVDLARDPRCGRTEETYGEDVMLATEMATAFVTAMQRSGVGCTLKHFAANFVADGGRDSHDIRLSEHALHEIHLRPYEAVIARAGPCAVMPAYHSIDGRPAACNSWLLVDVLRDRWGFDGITGSDYWAIDITARMGVARDAADAARLALVNGMDVEWPNSSCYPHLVAQVKRGDIPLRVLNRSVERVLNLKQRLGLFDDPAGAPQRAARLADSTGHRKLARRAAVAGTVLLKNKRLLPFGRSVTSVAVIGPNASAPRTGGYSGWGAPVISPLEGAREVLGSGNVTFAEGCANTGSDRRGFSRAIRAAASADAAILCVGNWSGGGWVNRPHTEGEGRDRSDLRLPGVQEELIEAVAAVNPRTVVVLSGGSMVEMASWVDQVPAILQSWYPGCEGGRAVADILWGRANPAGRLPLTFAKRTGMLPLTYDVKPTGRSYDYNDARGDLVQFPFGHGLSYTTFSYDNLRVSKSHTGGFPLRVRCTVANTGRRAGDEVVQLYVRDRVASLTRPLKELKGFRRIHLDKGEKRTVEFRLSRRDLSFLSHDLKMVFEPGEFDLMVGASSADIRLERSVRL